MLRVGQRDGQEFSYIYILNIYEYIEAANALTLRDWHDIVATSKKISWLLGHAMRKIDTVEQRRWKEGDNNIARLEWMEGGR